VRESDILHELDEVEFPTKIRGYDPFEVDELLERAREEISDLRSRAQAADDRARSAEEQLDVELDAARQARGEADVVLAAAKEEASRVLADARDEVDRLVTASEAEIRDAIKSGRNQLHEELAVLESRRDLIGDEIDLVEVQMAAHRDRILSAIEDLRDLTESLSVVSQPATLEAPVEQQAESSRFMDGSLGGLPGVEADPERVLHRIDVLAPVAETEISADPGGRVAELRRRTRGPDDDTVAIEAFSPEEEEGRFGTART